MNDDGTLFSFLFSSSSTTSIFVPLMATSIILVASGMYWLSWRKEIETTHHPTTTTTTSKNATASPTRRLKNVWDPTSHGTAPPTSSSSSSNKDRISTVSSSSSNKPFGSSYYYAHNNPNAKGGYKDGLKMEDYTMNGPRLLSKGGKPVNTHGNTEKDRNDGNDETDLKNAMMSDKENDQPSDRTVNKGITSSSSSSSSTIDNINSNDSDNKTRANTPTIPVRSITKYLWDDPGDTNGIATIRIESLPGLSPTNPNTANATGGGTMSLVDWKDVGTIDQVQAELVGEGMLVRVYTQQKSSSSATTTTPVLYELKIPKLYGEAESIKAIVKPKRLLIKITKKKKSSSILFSSKHSNSNLDVWPQPHRKV